MLAIKSERLSCKGESSFFHDCFAADREQAHSYRAQCLLRNSAVSQRRAHSYRKAAYSEIYLIRQTQALRVSGSPANFTPASPLAISARILLWSLPSGVAFTER